MKRKILTLIMLGVVVCTMLSSCSGADDPGSMPVSDGNPSSPVSAAPVDPQSSSQQDLRWISGIGEGCGSEQGYYRIQSEFGEEQSSTRISFIDYGTKVEVPLCNQPQCKHDNERCAAMLYAYPVIQSKIFTMDNSVFVLSTKEMKTQGNENADGLAGVSDVMALYRMNADGTDRTEILEISEAYQLGNELAAGAGCIFLSAVKSTADSRVAQPVLLKIDVNRKSIEELPFQGQPCGVYDGKIVISKTGYGDLSGLSDAETIAAIRNSKNTIATYDPATGELRDHASIPANDIILSFVYENRLIYSSGENSIFYLNLDTNESGVLTKSLPGRFSLVSQADGQMVCSFDDGAEINAKTKSCLKISCNTGETVPFTLYTRQSVNLHPVAILADAGNDYLVQSDIIEKEEYVSWMGVYQVNILSDGCSFIPKEDYWANNGNYVSITSLH